MSHKLFSSLIVLLIIAACAPATPPSAPTSTPVPVVVARLDEKVDVGGYSLRIVCTGEGTPTVILEADLGEPVVDGMNWYYVRSGIEKTNRICVYERAGVGSSDTPPTEIRTSQDMVNDLHTLLQNANVPGPYVLVGHNVGGLNAWLYASQYPDEVAGLVLVDAMHPDYRTETLTVLPPESPGESSILTGIRTILTDFVISSPEGIDLMVSAEQVSAAKLPADLPLVVITHSPDWRTQNIPPDVAEKVENVWQTLQKDLVNLTSNSSHVISTRPGHEMPHELPRNDPGLIIDAILKVIAESK